jgi:hypothetical protein
MGANPTQAYAVITFLAAFILIAAGCATNIFLIVIGLAVLVLSVFIFRKCRPWEHEES